MTGAIIKTLGSAHGWCVKPVIGTAHRCTWQKMVSGITIMRLRYRCWWKLLGLAVLFWLQLSLLAEHLLEVRLSRRHTRFLSFESI